jgi:hypothetical protein
MLCRGAAKMQAKIDFMLVFLNRIVSATESEKNKEARKAGNPNADLSCLPAFLIISLPTDIISRMSDFRDMARDPKHRRRFEKLLLLACQRGDADLVAERLSWGIDPNCTFAKSRTPLIANVRSSCPNAVTVQALLKAGADPDMMDETGLTALDYARRKLSRLQAKPRRQRKSPSLDENDQLQMAPEEQAELDKMRAELGAEDYREFFRTYWKERLRAAKRVFNDPGEVERIVEMLEAAGGK